MTRAIILAVTALAVPAGAQTTDGFWRLWSSREERFGPRAAALGGAVVAMLDDSNAARTNPALIGTLWRSELIGGFGTPGRADFTQFGFGGLIRDGLAFSWYVRRPATFAVQDAAGRLDFELTEGGAQYGQRFGRHLVVGVGVHKARLALMGESSAIEGGTRLRAGAGAGSTRLGASAGIAWDIAPWTLGAAFHTGATFEATRTATRDGAWDDPGSTFAVRRPWQLALGAAYKASLRVSLFAQADLRGAGKLRGIEARAAAPSSTAAGDAGARDLAYAQQVAERAGLAALRAGAQYALPLEGVSILFRAGVAHLTEAGLRRSAEALGRTVHAGALAPATRVSAGLGLAFEKGALDVAFDGESKWTVEARLRF